MSKNNHYKFRILHSSEEILKTQGIKGLTISNIVNQCSISKRSFYECFADKDELMEELKQYSDSCFDIKDEKQAILDVAEIAIGYQGFNNVNLESIAKEAGLKRGVIYKHFNDKYELLEACIEFQFNKLKEIVRQTYLISEEKPEDFIKLYIGGMAGFLNEAMDSALYKEVWSHINYREQIKKSAMGIQNFIKGYLIKTIEKGIQNGTFREDINVETFATIMLITINGMAYYVIDTNEPGLPIRKEVSEGIINFFIEKLMKENYAK